MKKYGIFALTIVLALSLCACSRKDKTNGTTGSTATVNTVPTTTKMTEMTMPVTMPTIDQNIPDPNVDPSSDTIPATDHTNAVG